MITTAPSTEYFRSSPLRQKPERVDRQKKVIYGAALMQLGRVNDDRPWFVDETTLAQVVELGSRPNKGLKARFTHPNMSDDGMGKFLGNWRNIRRDGDTVRGDLHLARAAFKSPHGDLGTYVMDLADDHPEEFGVSIAPRGLDRMAMEEAAEEDSDLEPIRLGGLRAADVVDDPAATRGGFFSVTDNESDIPARVTQFLDAHFADASPDVIRARFEGLLARYFSSKGVSIMADAPKTPETPAIVPQVDFSALMSKIDGLEQKLAAVPGQLQAAQAAEQSRRSEITALFANMGLAAADLDTFFSECPAGTVEQASLFACKLHVANKGGNPSVGGGTNDAPGSKDPDATFKAEYAKDAAFFKSKGHSEADYILSRRIDLGLESLVPANL